jgi:hypothetical protein
MPSMTVAFPSAFFLWPILLPTAALYLKNSLLSPLSSPGHRLSLTTFVDQASPPNLPDISFTCIATQTANPPKKFRHLQADIVILFCLIQSLSIFAAFVHPDHDGRAVSIHFIVRLRKDGWLISDTMISNTAYGDSVSGTCHLIIGIHSNTKKNCATWEFKAPTTHPSWHIGCNLWTPFNRPKMAVFYSMHDKTFNNHTVNNSGLPLLSATVPMHTHVASVPPGIDVLYYLHCPDQNPSSVVSASVISMDGLCPHFVPDKTPNLIGHHFGIKFLHDSHTYVQPNSLFEFISCHQLGDEITYNLLHPSNTFCLDTAIPGITSACIFDELHKRCPHILRAELQTI